MKALQKYPLPMKTGQECSILKNFGTKLCSMLDKRLDEFKAANPDDPSASKKYFANLLKFYIIIFVQLIGLDILKNAPVTQNITNAAKAAPKKRPAATSPKKKKPPAKKKASNDVNDDDAILALQAAPEVHIEAGQAQVKLLVDCSETSAA